MADRSGYIISYDVIENRKRNRICEILKDYGYRLQKSVFACSLDSRAMAELKHKIAAIIDQETDSVIFISLCAACDGRKRATGIDVFKEEKRFRIL